MKIKSVEFNINPLFFLILFLFSFVGMLPEVLIAFFSVALHEAVHILVAKNRGFNVNKIQLLPFGGVTWFEELLELHPDEEIKIAISGPGTNIFIAIISVFSIYLGLLNEALAMQIFEINVSIGLFNLLPAFPLDGGRIIRALLSTRMGMKEATEKITFFSRILAVILAIFSIWGVIYQSANFLLLLIAFYVYYNAVRYKDQAIYLFLHCLMQKEEIIKNKQDLPVECLVVFQGKPYYRILRYLRPDCFHIVYLLDKDLKISGKLTEVDLLKAFKKGDSSLRLMDILHKKGDEYTD